MSLFLFGSVADMREAASALKRVESVLEDGPPSSPCGQDHQSAASKDSGDVESPSSLAKSNDLVFDDVTFSYPNNPDAQVLNGVSLRLPVGKVTALVGASGAGKTTIVQVESLLYSDQKHTYILTLSLSLSLSLGFASDAGPLAVLRDLRWQHPPRPSRLSLLLLGRVARSHCCRVAGTHHLLLQHLQKHHVWLQRSQAQGRGHPSRQSVKRGGVYIQNARRVRKACRHCRKRAQGKNRTC